MNDGDCYSMGAAGETYDVKGGGKAYYNVNVDYGWTIDIISSKKQQAQALMQKAKELFGEENS